MTTILVVDDHSVVRMGLVALLSRSPGLQVVGEAARMDEAIDRVRSLAPDVVLMDVRLPDGSGIEGCRIIRQGQPETKVLMLTSFDDKDAAVAAVIAGASGYLLKQVEPEELVRAVRLVAEGLSLLDPSITRGVLDHLRAGGSGLAGEADLTDRERSILNLVGEGLTNREIAGRLYLSEKTVRNYVSSILQKLNLSNRTQAATYVSRRRLLGGGDSPHK
ncbi:MAG TPA: response regulator transcription factor [Symbiobacteriaceae bacterium]|jgi:DNA-binding NarL/FixJ family response regulator